MKEAGAVPFDAPGVDLGRRDGRSSCETIVLEHGWTAPALQRLAQVAHTADVTADMDMDAISWGLEAISSGFGLRTPGGPSRSKSPTPSMPGVGSR